MAAGMGSRYGGLKQVAEVGPGGETIVDYAIYDALQVGFAKVVFIIRRSIEEEFRAKYARWEDEVDVEYVFQELDMLPSSYAVPADRRKPWGTGHAVMQAARVLDSPFAVINADDFYGRHAFRVMSKHLGSLPVGGGGDYCMVGYELRKTLSASGPVTRGICRVSPRGFLERIVETAGVESTNGTVRAGGGGERLSGNEPTSMNMWGFAPSIFGHLRERFPGFLDDVLRGGPAEYLLPEVVGELIAEGKERVTVLRSPDPCIGVTHREDRDKVAESVRALIESGHYPSTLPVERR
jgi:hypothetical protein